VATTNCPVIVGDVFYIPYSPRHGRVCGEVTKINRVTLDYRSDYDNGVSYNGRIPISELYGSRAQYYRDGDVWNID